MQVAAIRHYRGSFLKVNVPFVPMLLLQKLQRSGVEDDAVRINFRNISNIFKFFNSFAVSRGPDQGIPLSSAILARPIRGPRILQRRYRDHGAQTAERWCHAGLASARLPTGLFAASCCLTEGLESSVPL